MLALAYGTSSFAGEIACIGKITVVMDKLSACGGPTAFQLTNTNGAWICPPTDKGTAIVLAAFIAGNEVTASIDNNGGAFWCSASQAAKYGVVDALPNYIVANNIQIKKL